MAQTGPRMSQDLSDGNFASRVEDNKLYKLKKTGASADDIVHVWNYVSAYIRDQMQKSKGVNISGLGQFTFTHRKTDVGNNKYILVQRPVFVLSEKFAQKHQLAVTKHHLTGQIAVSDLNFTSVAFDTPFSRDMVEECVRDVILEFSRALSAGRNIEFSFITVGRLTIRGGKVKMRFYKDFINSLDSPEEILNSMRDRPDTADSVMSRASAIRGPSVNTMVLPGIMEGRASRKPSMAAIEENAEVSLEQVGNESDPMMEAAIEKLEQSGELYFGDGQTRAPNQPDGGYNAYGAQELDAMGLPAMLLEERPHPATLEASEMLQNSSGGSKPLAPIPKAGAVNLDDINVAAPSARTPVMSPGAPVDAAGDMTRRSVTGSAPALGRSSTMPVDVNGRRSQLSPLAPPAQPAPRAMSRNMSRQSNTGAAWPAQPKVATPPADTECGHDNAGQELCYLCHQRAARNIPVSFDEEKKRREAEEDQILHEYQIMKNNEFVLNEQEKNKARRLALQKQAAFNLGVSEALLEKKQARAQPEHPKAYIFQRRPLTPPRYIKQQQLNEFLTKQMDHKDDTNKKERADKDFIERLEQVQLAEDLAAQREQYLKERHGEREKYKDALATQLRNNWKNRAKDPWWDRNQQKEYLLARNQCIKRPLHSCTSHLVNNHRHHQQSLSDSHTFLQSPPLDFLLKYKPMQVPDRLPDNEVFGKNDTTQADVIARREHSKKIASEQIRTVADRKRAEILKRLQDQQEEEEMLRKNKSELLEDRTKRYDRLVRNRQALEQEWVKAAEQKKGREIEDRLRCLTPGGLVHEQCDGYRRCAQCKKRTSNCGETNLWKESYYIPGARIMV